MSRLSFSACGAIVVLVLAALAGCGRTDATRVEWTTMGTVAAVQVRTRDSAVLARVRDRVRQTFDEIAKRLDVHRTDSEIVRLAPFDEVETLARADPVTRECYRTAFALARESGGAFNPRWRGARTLDFGAIAKGFAVDAAAQRLAGEKLDADVLIDLGGNLKSVRGTWRVGIYGGNGTIVLTNAMACATSAEYFRGKHIHDGRTGCAVTNGVGAVTVVHPTSATLADGLSTALFVLGRSDGERFLREHHPAVTSIWQ